MKRLGQWRSLKLKLYFTYRWLQYFLHLSGWCLHGPRFFTRSCWLSNYFAIENPKKKNLVGIIGYLFSKYYNLFRASTYRSEKVFLCRTWWILRLDIRETPLRNPGTLLRTRKAFSILNTIAFRMVVGDPIIQTNKNWTYGLCILLSVAYRYVTSSYLITLPTAPPNPPRIRLYCKNP